MKGVMIMSIMYKVCLMTGNKELNDRLINDSNETCVFDKIINNDDEYIRMINKIKNYQYNFIVTDNFDYEFDDEFKRYLHLLETVDILKQLNPLSKIILLLKNEFANEKISDKFQMLKHKKFDVILPYDVDFQKLLKYLKKDTLDNSIIKGSELPKDIEETVDKEVKELLLKRGVTRKRGYVHLVWKIKKEILRDKYNIDWLSPQDLNPHILFD